MMTALTRKHLKRHPVDVGTEKPPSGNRCSYLSAPFLGHMVVGTVVSEGDAAPIVFSIIFCHHCTRRPIGTLPTARRSREVRPGTRARSRQGVPFARLRHAGNQEAAWWSQRFRTQFDVVLRGGCHIRPRAISRAHRRGAGRATHHIATQ